MECIPQSQRDLGSLPQAAVGVGAAITREFPAAMITRKFAPRWRGWTVVSNRGQTPYSALALVALALKPISARRAERHPATPNDRTRLTLNSLVVNPFFPVDGSRKLLMREAREH